MGRRTAWRAGLRQAGNRLTAISSWVAEFPSSWILRTKIWDINSELLFIFNIFYFSEHLHGSDKMLPQYINLTIKFKIRIERYSKPNKSKT